MKKVILLTSKCISLLLRFRSVQGIYPYFFTTRVNDTKIITEVFNRDHLQLEVIMSQIIRKYPVLFLQSLHLFKYVYTRSSFIQIRIYAFFTCSNSYIHVFQALFDFWILKEKSGFKIENFFIIKKDRQFQT